MESLGMEISLDRWIPDDAVAVHRAFNVWNGTHTRAAPQCTDGSSGMVHFPDNKICRCKMYANRYHTQTPRQNGIQSQTFVRILLRSRSLAHSQRMYAFYAEKHIILMLMFIRIYSSHLRLHSIAARGCVQVVDVFHFPFQNMLDIFPVTRRRCERALARAFHLLLPTLCVSEIIRNFGKYALHERTSNVIYSVNGKHSVARRLHLYRKMYARHSIRNI